MEPSEDDLDLPATPNTAVLDDPEPIWIMLAGARGDFGCLIPTGRASILAFHAIAQRSKIDPDFPEHCLQLMSIDEEQTEYIEPYDDSGSDTEADDTEAPKLIWRGYFRFNVPTMRQQCVVGCGREGLLHFGVDMLLALPQSRSQHRRLGRRSQHAVFYHQSPSGALMISIQQGKEVHINGEKQLPRSYHIALPKTNIRFGDLDYCFRYTNLDDKIYREQLFAGSSGPPLSLGLTPHESDQIMDDFVVRIPYARGSVGVVLAGTQLSTGKLVAVKRIQRVPRNFDKTKTEIEISRYLAKNTKVPGHKYVCHLLKVIYSSGDDTTIGPSGLDDVFLFYESLGSETLFEMMVRPTCTYDCRKTAAFQLISGLDFMHSVNVTHRDIKPNNIVVLSYEPLHVAYIDTGCAMFDRTSIDHMQGTIAYLAPEVMRWKRRDEKASVKNSGTGKSTTRTIEQEISCHGVISPTANDDVADEPYTNSVDVYSLGLVLYQLLLGASCWWRAGMTEENHEVILKSLRDFPIGLHQHIGEDGLTDLIMRMLAWKSVDRPSTKDLLSHATWTSQKAFLEDVSNRTSRKRQRA